MIAATSIYFSENKMNNYLFASQAMKGRCSVIALKRIITDNNVKAFCLLVTRGPHCVARGLWLSYILKCMEAR